MFPVGAVGLALLAMRLSVSALLLLLVFGGSSTTFPWWEILLVYGIVASLCLGFYTPVSSVVCAFVELAALPALKGANALHLVVYVLLSFSMAIFGPGGFSIDARLFGRRLIDPETLQSF
jgi:hypothetical protein